MICLFVFFDQARELLSSSGRKRMSDLGFSKANIEDALGPHPSAAATAAVTPPIVSQQTQSGVGAGVRRLQHRHEEVTVPPQVPGIISDDAEATAAHGLIL